MTGLRIMGVVAMLGFASVTSAEEKSGKAAKPLITCDQIVETYKHNHSVDQTADALLVDQSRVAQCLKAAGITAPPENDR